VEKDLKQLNTDYIDLMLIHFPGKGDCSKTWAALENYHAKGVLKAIGVSNFKRSNIESLMKTAKVVPAVNQIKHNVLSHDDDTISSSLAHNITIEAYSPLKSGISRNRVIQSVAAAHSVSTYQVALKWILQHGHVLTFESKSTAHQKEDADIFNFTLTDDEMSKLDGLQTSSATLV